MFKMSKLKVNGFYEVAKGVKDLNVFTDLVQQETKAVRLEYSTLESVKNAFTSYKNGFIDCVLNGNKALYKALRNINNASNLDALLTVANQFDLDINKVKQLATQCQAVQGFNITLAETQSINDRYRAKVKEEQNNLKLVKDYKKMLSIAVQAVKSQDYSSKILGLALLTGRRVAEIACTAEIEVVGGHIVKFSGQLKTKKDEADNYYIPVLATPAFIAKGIKEVQALRPHYKNAPAKFHDSYSKNLSIKVKKLFAGFTEGAITPKDLRAIYATIACKHFKKENQTHQSYYADILGHSENDLATSNSYFDFYLN